jgi:Mn-containing catalase
MFVHNKSLQFGVRVAQPDPRFASLLLKQFRGANGELNAALQYFHPGVRAAGEKFFWPVVRSALDDGDALADEAIKQEQHGKNLLQHLLDDKPGETEYHAALQHFVKAAASTEPTSKRLSSRG